MEDDIQVPLARLGRSGLHVSTIALGTMMFGGRTSRDEAIRILNDARARGVNHIDTADAYNGGEAEKMIGELIADDRAGWIVATKLANSMGPGPNRRGLSRRWIQQATEASLHRLGADVIDIQYLHREDPDTPLEETVRAVADLIRAGKIRYFGVSNFRAWRIARLSALCDSEGIDRPVVAQVCYHMLNRSVETEVLPACHALGIGVVAYSPLARGVLTGKYRPETEPPAGSRAAAREFRIMQTEWHPANLAAAEGLREHAEKTGSSLSALATAWVLANPLVHAVLAGPRSLEQWQGYFSALRRDVTADDEAAVDALVAPGSTAIAGFIDPAYPIEGRPVQPA